jgi:DNA-binding CsgD family transcriptional regulator
VLAKELEERIIEMKEGGATLKQIAKAFNTSVATISVFLKKKEDKFKNRKWLHLSDKEKSEILEMKEKGMSVNQIAKTLGHSTSTISLFLKENRDKIKNKKWLSLSEEEKRFIKEKRDEGWSWGKIQEVTGRSIPTIKYTYNNLTNPNEPHNELNTNKENATKNESRTASVFKSSGGFFITLPRKWMKFLYIVAKKEGNMIIINYLENQDQIKLINNHDIILRKLNITTEGSIRFRIPPKWYKELNLKSVLLTKEGDTIKVQPINESTAVTNQETQIKINDEIENLKKKLENKQKEIEKLNKMLITKQKEIDRLTDEVNQKQKKIEELSSTLDKIIKAASYLCGVKE